MSCRNVVSDDGTSEPDATALQAAQACSRLLLFLLCFEELLCLLSKSYCNIMGHIMNAILHSCLDFVCICHFFFARSINLI